MPTIGTNVTCNRTAVLITIKADSDVSENGSTETRLMKTFCYCHNSSIRSCTDVEP